MTRNDSQRVMDAARGDPGGLSRTAQWERWASRSSEANEASVKIVAPPEESKGPFRISGPLPVGLFRWDPYGPKWSTS